MSKCVAHKILEPCARVGIVGDWWTEQHKSCTGSHSINSDDYISCDCECHRVKFYGISFPQFSMDRGPFIMNSNTGSAASYEDCLSARVIHFNEGGWTACGLDFVKGIPLIWTSDLIGVNCPECLRAMLLQSYNHWDEDIRKPIKKFLDEIGDKREFASECEIGAMIRIALRHPEEWDQDSKERLSRMRSTSLR